jgi:Ala-tRNA(Pro) deacylase
MKYLNLTPGSVTPFGLIKDTDKHVILFIDEEITQSDFVSFHPNINTASLIISTDGFFKFIMQTGNKFEILKLIN